MTPYKKPILASFLTIFGVIEGILVTLAGLGVYFNSPDKIENTGIAFSAILGGWTIALLFFGASQILDCIGKTAYYMEKLNQTLSVKSESSNTVLLIEKLEEQKEEQEKTNKLLADFLKRLQ